MIFLWNNDFYRNNAPRSTVLSVLSSAWFGVRDTDTLSRLEWSEVTKGKGPFDPSAFSAIERLPLPLSAMICLEI